MTWIHRGRRERIAALATVLALACGGDDEPTGNPGSIQLAVNPATLSVPQGASGVVNVSLTRTGGFDGVVTLAVTGLPTGITATVTPTQLSGTTTTASVALTVAAAVAPATHTATLTATAPGVNQVTATFGVTITGAPTGPTSVEYQFCDASAAPVFFAYQDGTGAWQAATRSVTGSVARYAFNLTQARGGVLIVYRTASPAVTENWRPSRARAVMDARRDRAAGETTKAQRSFLADAYVTEVLYASATELAQDGAESCALTQPTKSVTGTVLGVSAGQYGIVSLGIANDLFIGGTSTNPVTFEGVPPGPMDFVGSRMTPGNPPDRIIVLRNLNIPDGGALPAPIDFNAATTAPATANATITGSSGDDLEIFIDVVTANTDALLWFDLAPRPATTRPWAGLGSTTMASGDFHGIYAFANPRPFDANNYRFALKYVGPVADQTLSLGPTIAAPTLSQVAAGAYPRYRFQGTIPPEYGKGASVDVLGAAEGDNAFSIIATGAYLAGSGNAQAYDFTMPDIAGVTGFPAAARLTSGQNDVAVSAFGFTGPGIFDVRPNVGSEFRASVKGATIVAP